MDITIEQFKLYFLLACMEKGMNPFLVNTMRLLAKYLMKNYGINHQMAILELSSLVSDIQAFNDYSIKEMVFQSKRYNIEIFIPLLFLQCNLYNYKHPSHKVTNIEQKVIDATQTIYPEFDSLYAIKTIMGNYTNNLKSVEDLTNV